MRGPSSPVRLVASLISGVMLALLFAGCLNFQEPEELGARDGELAVQLFVTDTLPVTARVSARFLRPRGEDGRYGELADPTIRVFERTVQPDTGEDVGELYYAAPLTLTQAELDRSTIRVEGPVVEAGRPRLGVTLPYLRRSGPDSLVLSDGDEDVALPLELGSKEAYSGLSDLSWLLVIESDESERSRISIRASGQPPDTLRISRDLLAPVSSGAVLEARFGGRLHVRRTGADLPYQGQFDATVVVHWTVAVE